VLILSQILFTKTRILSVKVCTLECFLAMVPILTQVRWNSVSRLC
jgi:hypothetical protein